MYTKQTTMDQVLHNVKTRVPPDLQAPLLTALRAFGLSWGLTTAPGFLSLVLKLCVALTRSGHHRTSLIRQFLFIKLPKLLKSSIYQNGFPWLVTGAFASHRFVRHVLQRWSLLLVRHKADSNNNKTKISLLADNPRGVMFLSAAASMLLVRRFFPNTKTMEFTFFTLVRALDVCAHRAYQSPTVTGALPAWVMDYGSVIVFSLACTEIMFSWFYEPSRLPKGYSMWITKMAQMDERLLWVLRSIKDGSWVYGKDTGMNDLLGNYCLDLGLPYEAGVPARGRIPCRVVHGGQPWGCEVHAMTRFAKGFAKVFLLYFSVHLTPPLLFKRQKLAQDPLGSIQHILKASIRSSTFLATFITLIWYSICLTRTRIGHQLLGIQQERLDDTLGPLIGSAMCGLSLMIENKHRRGEMALYVVPRALFSVTERLIGSWYNKGRWWEPKLAEATETLVFATSVMTVLNAMYKDKDMVRSSVRGILGWIMKYELNQDQDAYNKNNNNQP
ncbi:hypothetical protein BC941DRAFT_408384 [Chlamydoabsidia padenii]|nr:hypothetical protein BC941DRAFT_408384 [Chlamydoabsidia padenii]